MNRLAIAIILLGDAITYAGSQQTSVADLNTRIQALQTKKVALMQKLVDRVTASFESGQSHPKELLEAKNRLLDAMVAAESNQVKRIELLEEKLNNVSKISSMLQELHNVGNVSFRDLLLIQSEQLDAEIELLHAQQSVQ